MLELYLIGVVLGAWSVLVDSLALNEATEHDLGASGLLRQLRTEELIYREFVRQLLAPVVPEADLVQLSSRQKPNLGLWRDEALLFSLEKHLGKTRSKAVLEILEGMKRVLRSLTVKLKNYKPAAVHACDLKYFYIANV